MRHLLLALLIICLSSPVFAATADGPAVVAAPVGRVDTDVLPERLTGSMRAITPVVLRYENAFIMLWGIKSVTGNGFAELKALEVVDALVQDQQVNCRIIGGTNPRYLGRCATQDSQDIAVDLLSSGYMVVDRMQTDGTPFAAVYQKAQESARALKKGIWAGYDEQKKLMPSWMEPYLALLLPFGLVFGPLLGLLVIALVMRHWLKNMAEQQAQETARAAQKEERLQNRERQVLVSTLEAELLENKNKIEAFLAIYGDMLNDLKNETTKPRYQDSGDIVQKHPNYSKTVFDSNIGKLSLLDMKLAGHLSKIYAVMSKDSEYINLEPDLPLDTAIKLLEKIIQDTKELVPDLDAAIQQLEASAAA